MLRITFAAGLVAGLLAGCAETITMRNPKSGEIVTCGPYRTTGMGAQAGAMLAQQCVQDWKEQGFVRAAN